MKLSDEAQHDLGAGADTATRLKAAAVHLFATQGFAATSIRQIAGRAHLSNAGIYHFAASKEALLLDIMREMQLRLNESTQVQLAHVSRPEDRLGILISGLVGTHAVNRMSSSVTDREIRALTPGSPGHTEVVAMRDAYEAHWSQTLSDGVGDGVFRIADQRLTRLALMAMCTGVSDWYHPDGATPLPAICREFVGIGLAAVGARRHGTPIDPAQVTLIDLDDILRVAWEPTAAAQSDAAS